MIVDLFVMFAYSLSYNGKLNHLFVYNFVVSNTAVIFIYQPAQIVMFELTIYYRTGYKLQSDYS